MVECGCAFKKGNAPLVELACEQTDTCDSTSTFCQSRLVLLPVNQQERTITKKTEAPAPHQCFVSQEAGEDFTLAEIPTGR